MHFHRYIEIPAPRDLTRDLLAEQPPFDGQRLGDFWHWHDELWSIQQSSFDDGRILWQGTAPALPQANFLLSVTLHDAVIATHLELHLAVTFPGARWDLLGNRRRERHIAAGLDAALHTLRCRAQSAAPGPVAPHELPDAPEQLAELLQATHPATVAAFREMAALPSLQAVAQLDRRWQATEAGAFAADVHQQVSQLPATQADFDLIYAGGGLGTLHAAVMVCCYRYRVLLFDRGEVGCAHREWNISDQELQALVRIGLFTQAELEQVVMRRYRDGLVHFWPDRSAVRPAELHLPAVLNVALDAAGLLKLARAKIEAAGGIVLDRRSFKRMDVQKPGWVAVELEHEDGGSECFGGRVLLDGMGATSPLALRRFAGQPFAGVCPTVGSVVTGLEHGPALDQHHPDVGDILVSVTDTQRDRQLIWEGFAGRGDELTVYVFYYDLLKNSARAASKQAERQPSSKQANERRPASGAARHSLLDLFEDYFRLLPTYKRPGPEFRHIKPVYGFIPARHTQRRQTVPLLPGVLPIGDSSAQQSPLTFCGFGSHVRNLERTTGLLDHVLRRELLAPEHLGQISAYQANVALNWVLSRFMQPWSSPNDVNRLQNIFARVLNEIGVDLAVRFFQDQMTWRDYGRILNHTLAIYKPIIPTTLAVLGPRDSLRWFSDWLRFSAAAATAALGRALGDATLDGLMERLERDAPALAFRLAARRAEWQVMGWNSRPPIGGV
jgi:lycopene cyclase CruA